MVQFLSATVVCFPAAFYSRTLEWQKVRFESAQSLSLNRGRSLSPEAEIALEDVSRLRDEVRRGRERLFHASLSVTLHADNADTLKELTQRPAPTSPPPWASWTTWLSGKGKGCCPACPWA